MTKPTVIIHTDATGWVDFLMTGDVNVYIVDERYPGDRVYQWTEKGHRRRDNGRSWWTARSEARTMSVTQRCRQRSSRRWMERLDCELCNRMMESSDA